MAYLMAGQSSELDRLRLQSLVWEPAGERLLHAIGDGEGRRVLDVGCGALGWLRVLSRWVGPSGVCTGTDVDPGLLAAAEQTCVALGLEGVELAADDLFDSRLPEKTFDLVHARFQLAPLGRFEKQVTSYMRLVRPGGVLVLEDPDCSSWKVRPHAEATTRLIELIQQAFLAADADFNAGVLEFELLRRLGLEPRLRAEVVALEPGHPYLRLPLQFAASLRPRLLELVEEDSLDQVLEQAERELTAPDVWGTTFTLLQTWATVGHAGT